MKRILALFLTLLLVISAAACGEEIPEQTTPETTESATQPAPEETLTQPAVQIPEGTPNYFQLSISEEDGTYKSLSAFEDGPVRSLWIIRVISAR